LVDADQDEASIVNFYNNIPRSTVKDAIHRYKIESKNFIIIILIKVKCLSNLWVYTSFPSEIFNNLLKAKLDIKFRSYDGSAIFYIYNH